VPFLLEATRIDQLLDVVEDVPTRLTRPPWHEGPVTAW